MSYVSRFGGQVLLNPSERASKYAKEIKEKKAYTNDLQPKKDEKGKQIKLNKEQLAFRAGYLEHAKDSNHAFKYRNPNYKRKTKNLKIK